MTEPRLSVVIATYNRVRSLRRLLEQLSRQALAADAFEVLVVDDGSAEPVAPLIAGTPVPRRLQVLRIPNSGQGAARHHGIERARGDVLVIVDDDMQVAPDFLDAHLAWHERVPRAVVLGNIQPDAALASMPLHERYHAQQLARYRSGVEAGRTRPRGVHLCTGNVSMRRADYFAAGGFDLTMQRSEDRELGIRLERTGCAIVFGADAVTVHSSDHTDTRTWLRRAHLYGRQDLRMARMHRDASHAHPWRYWPRIHPAARPLLTLALVWPAAGHVLARVAYKAATLADRAGARRRAVDLAALAFAAEYFRGVREGCGSLGGLRAEIRASRPPMSRPPAPKPGLVACFRAMVAGIRADHESVRRYRRKYHGEEIAGDRILVDLCRKIGFQMMAMYRVMRFFDASGVPLMPQIMSRLIRHLYGAEIHWRTRIAPGVSIVHGVGLVLSHAAEVGPGCILFHNVTLGENVDPVTGAVGAPRLGADVHVGPGATLLGPIEVGAGSKVMAGVTVTRDVPARSLVAAPEIRISPRMSRRMEGAPLARVG